MLIYAGIDEAGYGPMLGPLCVACTVFAVEPRESDAHPGAPDLWKRLNNVISKAGKSGSGTSSRRAAKGRILIDDSKKLKGPRDGRMHPLKHLERGVLSFLASITDRPQASPNSNGVAHSEHSEERVLPRTDAELMQWVGCNHTSHPWWQNDVELPLGATEGELRIDAARLAHSLQESGVTMHAICCEAIDAGSFNDQVDRMGTKAGVNWCSAMRLADEIMQRWGDHHPRI
ncbi:MAG TPA: hypothetical protein VG711_01885, partial [Phycisphaerales bacterium]|nr:hypothetical protein [Phycisphaerales bacterium]